MILQLFIGGIIIAVTVVFQAFAFDFIIRKTRRLEKSGIKRLKTIWKSTIIAIVVLAVFTVLIAEIWLWALWYTLIGALPDLYTALYFSTVSFTTVGYGDIVPGEHHRLFGAIEAANGFLMFGWATAFIFEIISKIYQKEGHALEK